MELFYALGLTFAAWAVAITAVGLKNPDFPRSAATQRLVVGISVLLAAATLASVIHATASEGEPEHAGTVQVSDSS